MAKKEKTDADNQVVLVTNREDPGNPISFISGNRRAEVTLGDGRTGWANAYSDAEATSKAIKHARSKD